MSCLACPRAPTISTGPCLPTVAGPYAAWMPRKSLQGRTCGVSRDGRRATTLQPIRRSAALELAWLYSRANRNPDPQRHKTFAGPWCVP
ncbi:hypothetical protein DYQ94_01115 [Xanthomonas sp. LMG 8993]|nr:hypothetical protein [Xanthomonas sp. LMG 8993]QWN01093.1 hypothetical protein DGN21_18655 [Xanthomonas sp. MLO165]